MKRIVIPVLIALLLSSCAGKAEILDTNPSAEPDIETTATEINTENTVENMPEIQISEERALEIASEYLGVKEGDVDEHSGFPYDFVVSEKPSSEAVYYEVVLKWLVDNHHWSTVSTVYVDGTTGECSNSKG